MAKVQISRSKVMNTKPAREPDGGKEFRIMPSPQRIPPHSVSKDTRAARTQSAR